MSHRLKVTLILACAVLLIALYSLQNPSQTGWALRCPFKLLTGWQCGGCGSQRALHAFLHGHFAEAAAYNYFLIPAIPYALALLFAWMLPEGNLRRHLRKVLEHRTVVLTYVLIYCTWTVVRNLLHL